MAKKAVLIPLVVNNIWQMYQDWQQFLYFSLQKYHNIVREYYHEYSSVDFQYVFS